MPVSSVQPIEFVKKSGMQYENLKGDFIVRVEYPLRENMTGKCFMKWQKSLYDIIEVADEQNTLSS